MSNLIEKLPAIFEPPDSSAAGNGILQMPTGGADVTQTPLQNLSYVRARMESLQQFLSSSVNANTLIGRHQMDMVSAEIASAIHQVIVNGAALLASAQPPQIDQKPPKTDLSFNFYSKNPNFSSIATDSDEKKVIDPKIEIMDDDTDDDYEIIELDAVELLAEHIHFCDICGKGFKRDANLRMHMRAHGNQYKTLEALAKPPSEIVRGRTRFSCPYLGCYRNKSHEKFKPLKSAICVKNHFKRSHCPKMYYCNRCNKKTFSVLADLKSHLKHCGETRWKCSCGTSFSRKDKLFGHMALFEGHMPAVEEEECEKGKEAGAVAAATVDDEDEEEERETRGVKEMEFSNSSDNGLFEGLLDEFGSIENFCFQDVLGDGFSFL